MIGPWTTEPNHVETEHAGLPVILHRNAVGAWCGYVGVPEGHPAYGRTYTDLENSGVDIDVHGGLTYSEACRGPICHVKKDGEPERWWLGFDCCHMNDLMPTSGYPIAGQVYRDQAYVTAEAQRLADQLAAMTAPGQLRLV